MILYWFYLYAVQKKTLTDTLEKKIYIYQKTYS